MHEEARGATVELVDDAPGVVRRVVDQQQIGDVHGS
jgi:hypothetical protein